MFYTAIDWTCWGLPFAFERDEAGFTLYIGPVALVWFGSPVEFDFPRDD
jgi:hypothetical protein